MIQHDNTVDPLILKNTKPLADAGIWIVQDSTNAIRLNNKLPRRDIYISSGLPHTKTSNSILPKSHDECRLTFSENRQSELVKFLENNTTENTVNQAGATSTKELSIESVSSQGIYYEEQGTKTILEGGHGMTFTSYPSGRWGATRVKVTGSILRCIHCGEINKIFDKKEDLKLDDDYDEKCAQYKKDNNLDDSKPVYNPDAMSNIIESNDFDKAAKNVTWHNDSCRRQEYDKHQPFIQLFDMAKNPITLNFYNLLDPNKLINSSYAANNSVSCAKEAFSPAI